MKLGIVLENALEKGNKFAKACHKFEKENKYLQEQNKKLVEWVSNRIKYYVKRGETIESSEALHELNHLMANYLNRMSVGRNTTT